MKHPQREEARLIRRITHLRSILRYTEDTQIVGMVKEFIAATETKLVRLKPDPKRQVTLH